MIQKLLNYIKRINGLLFEGSPVLLLHNTDAHVVVDITTVIKTRVLHCELQHETLSFSTGAVVQFNFKTLDAGMKSGQNVWEGKARHIKVNEIVLCTDTIEVVLVEQILSTQFTTRHQWTIGSVRRVGDNVNACGAAAENQVGGQLGGGLHWAQNCIRRLEASCREAELHDSEEEVELDEEPSNGSSPKHVALFCLCWRRIFVMITDDITIFLEKW